MVISKKVVSTKISEILSFLSQVFDPILCQYILFCSRIIPGFASGDPKNPKEISDFIRRVSQAINSQLVVIVTNGCLQKPRNC